MPQKQIFDFLSNGLFHETTILKQYWKQNRYNYRNNPRPDYGLMLLIHGEVKFTLEHGTVTAKAGDLVFLPKFCRYEAIFENVTDDYLVNFDAVGSDIHIDEPVLLFSGTPIGCYDAYAALVEEHISPHRSALRVRGLFHLVPDSIVSRISRSVLPEQTLAKKPRSFSATNTNSP